MCRPQHRRGRSQCHSQCPVVDHRNRTSVSDRTGIRSSQRRNASRPFPQDFKPSTALWQNESISAGEVKSELPAGDAESETPSENVDGIPAGKGMGRETMLAMEEIMGDLDLSLEDVLSGDELEIPAGGEEKRSGGVSQGVSQGVSEEGIKDKLKKSEDESKESIMDSLKGKSIMDSSKGESIMDSSKGKSIKDIMKDKPMKDALMDKSKDLSTNPSTNPCKDPSDDLKDLSLDLSLDFSLDDSAARSKDPSNPSTLRSAHSTLKPLALPHADAPLTVRFAALLYDFTAQSPQELSAHAGDLVRVVEEAGPWTCVANTRGEVGARGR